jgi:antitoxin MazE
MKGTSMTNVTTTHVIRIGNSRGVRIPKLWLEQLDLGDEVEMAVRANQLVIRSARRPRKGWEEQFRAMHERGDDRLIEGFPASAWDEAEWQW